MSEQAALWKGPSGHAWVDMQELLDGMLRPFDTLLVDAVSRTLSRGRVHHVLDIGCGTGSTTVALAHRLGADVLCTGIDISEPMLAAARDRARREDARATFVLADARSHTFEGAPFDAMASRFGVMFFDDPVRAFTNLRRAASEGAALHFVAWRSAAENPFMTTAERAAAPLAGARDRRRPRSVRSLRAWKRRALRRRLLARVGAGRRAMKIACAKCENNG